MIPDELNLSGQELQILSELDSRQYGQLKDNVKKRALVSKVMSVGWSRGEVPGDKHRLFIASCRL